MKQTAVDWLVKKLNQKIDFIPMHKWDEIADIVTQSKAMEKEQIIEAHGKKTSRTLVQGINLYGIRTGEQYYEETFRGVDD